MALSSFSSIFRQSIVFFYKARTVMHDFWQFRNLENGQIWQFRTHDNWIFGQFSNHMPPSVATAKEGGWVVSG